MGDDVYTSFDAIPEKVGSVSADGKFQLKLDQIGTEGIRVSFYSQADEELINADYPEPTEIPTNDYAELKYHKVKKDGNHLIHEDEPSSIKVASPRLNIQSTTIKAEKSVDKVSRVQKGQTLEYTIKLTNTNGFEVKDILVRDEGPEGVTYVEGGDLKDGFVEFEAFDLGAGETKELKFKVKVDIVKGSIINQAYFGLGGCKKSLENDLPIVPTNEVVTELGPGAQSGGISTKGDRGRSVIIARADLYPDSLTASVLARAVDAPILLTASDKLDDRVAREIERLEATKAYVIGGEISISPRTFEEIKGKTNEVERIGGIDRYETSALLAKKVTDIVGNKQRVAIASGEVFPDALTISPFAAKEGYPILLVRKDLIPESAQDMMDKLGVEKTYISGGENTISKAVEDMLPGVEMRMWGQDRYGTSEAIAKTMFPSSTSGFIASGQVFPDALVIGPIGAKENAPVLLVRENDVPEVISSYLATSSIDKMIIAGGPDTISEAVAKELGHNIDRIFGIDRIETAIAISQRYYPTR